MSEVAKIGRGGLDLPAGAEPTLGDYLSVLKRRGRLLCGVVAVTVLGGFLIAYRVPPLYASTGILLAGEPEVPEHVVRSTIPYDPDDKVRIITQRVLTNDNLTAIIAEQALYPGLPSPSADAIEAFREHLVLGAEDPDILENLLGPSKAADAMAFSLTFSDPSPRVARDVAKRLVTLYLDENQRARREQAADTTRFLKAEATRLEAELEAHETRLAAFRSEHSGSLPSDLERQQADRVQRDLELADQEIRSLRERRDGAATALVQLSPNAPVLDENGRPILGTDERLTLLERRYAQLSAVYAPDHPDVQRVRRELDALRGAAAAPGAGAPELRAELSAREDELAAARQRYSSDHPDVQRLERIVTGLRAAVAAAPASAPAYASQPDNPQYIQRRAQLRATESDLAAASARRDELAARLKDLERHAAAAPNVERELGTLNRGYEQLLDQYGDVQSKLREAEMAANLESEGHGDRFTVLQAPQLPTSPLYPNRIAVLLLTLIVAFVFGTGAVAVAERADTTIRHPRDVAEHFGAPPIVAIPYVLNGADVLSHSRRRLVTVAMTCLWAGTIAFLVMTPA